MLTAAAALFAATGITAGPTLADGGDPAHMLADRFAASGKKPAAVAVAPSPSAKARDESLKAYEDEMLARARTEAEARAKADLAREEQIAAERKRAETEENGRKLSERLRAAREARRAKEAQDRSEAEARMRAEKAAEETAALRRADEEMKARSEAAAKAAEQSLGMARDRFAEHRKRLAEKIARQLAAHPPHALGGPVQAISAGDERFDGRTVTVLLVMDAGKKGIRRWNKNADPMLCVDESCYISRGPDTAAKAISRSKAFGPGVALGERAGACRDKLVCAFRGVALTSEKGWMQPIDLRILRHDRRAAHLVSADKSCRVQRGRLSCSGVIDGGDYRAWIVPEPTAERAGSEALQAALQTHLAVAGVNPAQ
ncbi:MAG: hypothetical protein JNM89_06550 [Hyphomicrobiaceae bacterium]|nr:hypothetical protein [Hyphomicrobiaceae bacterium]